MASTLAHDLSLQLRDNQLLAARTIILSEPVTPSSAKKVIADLLVLEATSTDPITLFLNSPGGEVSSGFAIYDTIRFIKSPVHCVSTGLCASIATIINVAVPKAQRLSLPNARFLIHQPLISGQVYGQASDIEITAEQILKTRERINRILSEACGQTVSRIEQDGERDYWMDAEEALAYGLIGRIVTKKLELG